MNERLFDRARQVIPGGVNSPVRSFRSVGGNPFFVKKGSGHLITGECGRELIDYCMSWGALIAGHAHPVLTGNLTEALQEGTSFGAATRREVELAELIVDAVPSVEKVRLTSSGTEAVMSAVRLARGWTGKKKIIKFDGAYHGHADCLLVRAGSGVAALGAPGSAGVPEGAVRDTIALPFNDPERLGDAVDKYGDDLAAIIAEPVMANCGVIAPRDGFLQLLRDAASRCGAVLIFDEVITGFRLSYGGAQGLYGVIPDMTCLGKIIGGGMPVGAFGGRSEIMDRLVPDGDVYQAGTLSGNPISVAAGITVLKMLAECHPYDALKNRAELLCRGLEEAAKRSGARIRVNRTASMFSIFFGEDEVLDYNDAMRQDKAMFARFYHAMLDNGVYLSPSAFETNFLSTAHGEKEIEKTIRAAGRAFGVCGELN